MNHCLTENLLYHLLYMVLLLQFQFRSLNFIIPNYYLILAKIHFNYYFVSLVYFHLFKFPLKSLKDILRNHYCNFHLRNHNLSNLLPPCSCCGKLIRKNINYYYLFKLFLIYLLIKKIQ